MLFLFIAMVRAAIGRLRNNRKNKAVHIALPPSQPSPILCTVRGKALETLRLNPSTPLCFLSEHKANDSGQLPSLEQFVSGIFLLPMDKKIENKVSYSSTALLPSCFKNLKVHPFLSFFR
jgi:hypothetical protein